MTGPEVTRAFDKWCQQAPRTSGWTQEDASRWAGYADVYPLYIGGSLNGQWYVRERMPGTRVWRAEDDGGFTLLAHPPSATSICP